jgi:hypothetical protein
MDQSIRLQRIQAFVASHGFAASIQGGAVMIEIPFIDGSVEIEQAESISEAREVLGY